MSNLLRGLTVALAIFATVADADAQDWRTLTNRRQRAGEQELRVRVRFGMGKIEVGAAESGTLYRSTIRYDADTFRPLHDYKAGLLTVGIDGGGAHVWTGEIDDDAGRLELALGPNVPLDLDFEMGAVDADIELGGLRIRRAAISTGASDTRLRFSQQNPERLEGLTVKAGAAAMQIIGLGNANAEQLSVSGGAGEIVLDFSGAWRRDLACKVEMGLGALTLRIPRGVGLRVDKDTFLVSFDSQELVKRGDAYYSLDWEEAEHHLTLDISGALGSVDVHWLN
ncbi:MAG TPA: hypothetical protein VF188_10045 [Longimicrobiales bacterium]